MKIFAKRKRKAASAGAKVLPAKKERSTFASDPIVEELLKKDPKEWNSKERRMIKRYQERKAESEEGISGGREEDSQPAESEIHTAAAKTENEGKNEKVENEDDSERDNNDETDGNSSDSDEGGEDEENSTMNGPAAGLETDDNEDSTPTKDESWTADALEVDEKDDKNDDEKVDPEHEVYKLLEKLNSKMKRTLSRKLDREGATALDDVRDEANKILDGTSDDKDNKKREAEISEKDLGAAEPSKKKRKKEVDWSNLSPEERLRREEQRRKQQEAAEMQARGEDKTPGYKHPLNSERRRANRRKPKWKNGSSPSETPPVKNEHNHSGYFHRKQAA